MELTIVINDIPPSLNKYAGRQNVWQYRKEKELWKEIVMQKAIKLSSPYEKAIVSIHYIFPTKHRHDPDNYAGKFLLDGLVQGEIIKDDDFEHIQLRLSAEYIKGIKKTIITVEEQ